MKKIDQEKAVEMDKDGMDRRTFLKMGGLFAAAGISIPAASEIFMRSGLAASLGELSGAPTGVPAAETSTSAAFRWTMVAEVDKCDGCKICEEACKDENNLPRYEGDNSKFDVYWMRVLDIKEEVSGVNTEENPIPVPCMHCEKPPCTHVCPTKASFRRKDGIVLVDKHRCIGCRYCIIACPYRVRYMIFKDIPDDQWTNRQVPKLMRGVASKCSYCVHRVDQGILPRCVVECPNNVLHFGDRNDPESDVAKLLEAGKATVLRPNLQVNPSTFYLGLGL
jgi:tetrathionate reductase subunit B